jgi:hypothetical protein
MSILKVFGYLYHTTISWTVARWQRQVVPGDSSYCSELIMFKIIISGSLSSTSSTETYKVACSQLGVLGEQKGTNTKQSSQSEIAQQEQLNFVRLAHLYG